MTADTLAGQTTATAAATSVAASADATDDLVTTLDEVRHKAYRIALYRLGEREAALDVVQDSMLRLMERYPHKPRSELVPLFYTILNNRITDAHRWNKLWRSGYRVLGALGVAGTATDTDTDTAPAVHDPAARADHEPDAQTLGTELRQQIDRALWQLSDRQRTVFLLREWQGLTVEETARAIGCSAGSIKQHHFRALRALRRELAGIRVDETHVEHG